MSFAKRAGEEAALSAFGVSHGTPKPPPTWAQDWLKEKRKTGTQNLTIPSMSEKRALLGGGVGEAALLGGGLHLGANVVQKLLRRFRPQTGMRNFSTGLSHGLSGQKLHPGVEHVLRYGAGPESLVNYEMGKQLAEQVKHLPPVKQRQYLQQIAQHVGESEHVAKEPVVRSAIGGIEHFLKGDNSGLLGKFPQVAEGAKPTMGQRIIGPAAIAATTAAVPHAGIQFGWNAIRNLLAKKVGPTVAAKQLAAGAKGHTMHPALQGALDYAVSPSINDPRRLGLALNKEYEGLRKGVGGFTARKNLPNVPMPDPENLVDFASRVHQRNQAAKPPTAAAPAPQGTRGMMTKALLGGGALLAARNALKPDEERREY